MVDFLALALSHGLLAFAIWRLLQRDDLDADAARASVEDKDGLDHRGGPLQNSRAPESPRATPRQRRRGVIWPRSEDDSVSARREADNRDDAEDA